MLLGGPPKLSMGIRGYIPARVPSLCKLTLFILCMEAVRRATNEDL